ncbi:MAG: hypothetical protein QM775_12690 [Pirellulales bacterium]
MTINRGTTGTLTLAPASTTGGIYVGPNAGTATINAPLVASTAQTWNVDGTGTSALVISGATTFTAAVNKAGNGALSLTAANSGSGIITLSGGTLNINNAAALGTGRLIVGVGTTINNSTAAGITLSTNNPQTWNGNFTFTGTQSLNMGTGAVTLGNNILITASCKR